MAKEVSSTELIQKTNSTSSCQNINKNSFVPVRESRSFGGTKSDEVCIKVTEFEKITNIIDIDSNIRTRDHDTMSMHITGPDILLFQGHVHSKEEIAPVWKKDCRMWLWKSTKSKRRYSPL
ncbi:uncharacterized protein LOC142320386 [Lycorma delicatula]|uniref:uncharacterized protein LOC142320386 n=1 Tax=Lycorma delicatula TaxID=130591 RepID=UPI003F5180B0